METSGHSSWKASPPGRRRRPPPPRRSPRPRRNKSFGHRGGRLFRGARSALTGGSKTAFEAEAFAAALSIALRAAPSETEIAGFARLVRFGGHQPPPFERGVKRRR